MKLIYSAIQQTQVASDILSLNWCNLVSFWNEVFGGLCVGTCSVLAARSIDSKWNQMQNRYSKIPRHTSVLCFVFAASLTRSTVLCSVWRSVNVNLWLFASRAAAIVHSSLFIIYLAVLCAWRHTASSDQTSRFSRMSLC